MALLWGFRCYVSASGTDEIRAAYNARRHAQAKFRSRLTQLARLPHSEWHETLFKKLHRECEGLWEIRFKAGNVQQRPLGFRSGPNEFTILFWAEEKSSRWVPANACEQALKRKAEVLEQKGKTNALWLALE